jgi:hypothetical protein
MLKATHAAQQCILIIAFCVVEHYCGKHTVSLPWRRIQYLYNIYLNNTENNNKNQVLLRFIIVAVCIVEIIQDRLFI